MKLTLVIGLIAFKQEPQGAERLHFVDSLGLIPGTHADNANSKNMTTKR